MAATTSVTPPRQPSKGARIFMTLMHMAVFILSALLIVFISIDSFEAADFLQNESYMKFQFWVCIFFIFDFFVELFYSHDKSSYLRRRWLFLLLSIPFLNIILYLQIPVTNQALDWVRFLPLCRAAMAMAIVVGYISHDRATSLLASYAIILLAFGYFGSLIFYDAEAGVNPKVTSYWEALWWTLMDMTTIGCSIEPVTLVGRIVAVITGLMGMLIIPFFAAFVTSVVQRTNQNTNQ